MAFQLGKQIIALEQEVTGLKADPNEHQTTRRKPYSLAIAVETGHADTYIQP